MCRVPKYSLQVILNFLKRNATIGNLSLYLYYINTTQYGNYIPIFLVVECS